MTSSADKRTLGKYRLLAKIGEGGMASVYLAVALGPAGFNKLVVIKEVLPELAEDPDHLSMFLDEARLAARLNHPNVAQTHEVGTYAGRHFLAMEYLDGQPLVRLRRRIATLPLPFPGYLPIELRVLRDVLTGLQYAHNLTDYDGAPLRVVHRDMSPHNVLVTYEGQTKILDFGIAKTIDSSARTRTGVLKGKVGYMAPEQARSEIVDSRADLYGVGVMLWEALAGRRLWKGLEEVAIIHRVVTGDIPSPRSVNPAVPPELEAICGRAMAVDPTRRFQSAGEFRAALEAFVERAGFRASQEDAAGVMNRIFAEERKQMATIVDEQLRFVRPARIDESIEVLRLPGSGAYPSAGHDSVRSAPRYTPTLNAAAHEGSNSIARSVSVSHAPQPRSPGWIAVVTSAVVAAMVAVGSTIWLRRGATSGEAAAPASASQPQPPPAPPAQTAAAPEAAASVAVRVETAPRAAKVFLDDVLLGTTPYTGTQPKDGRQHRLRIEAQGYETKQQDVVLDRDIGMVMSLDRVVRGGPPRGKSGEGSDPSFTTPGTGAKQNIDPDNPYKNR